MLGDIVPPGKEYLVRHGLAFRVSSGYVINAIERKRSGGEVVVEVLSSQKPTWPVNRIPWGFSRTGR